MNWVLFFLRPNCCRCMLPSSRRSCRWDPIDTIDSRSVCPSPCTRLTRRMDACHRIVCMPAWCHINTRPIVRMALAHHNSIDIVVLQCKVEWIFFFRSYWNLSQFWIWFWAHRSHATHLSIRLHRKWCQPLSKPYLCERERWHEFNWTNINCVRSQWWSYSFNL